MTAFFSPLVDPATWTLEAADVVDLPASTRYAGYRMLGVRATKIGGRLAMPVLGILRKAPPTGAPVAIEIQVNPFPVRRVLTQLAFGCPTFYLLLPDDSGLAPFTDGDTATGGDDLGSADEVTIVMCGQDRVARHPAFWTAQIDAAIVAAAGSPAPWTVFRDAVGSALAPAGEPPVVLLDHSGAPLSGVSVRLMAGGDDLTLAVEAADAGDLQRTVARRHAADPGAVPRSRVFQGAASVTIAMLPAGDHQLALLEDGSAAANQIAVPAVGGHVTSTDLPTWFAPQFATPTGLAAPALARYTRGNQLTPFVNGPEFFDDLFHELHAARNADGGFHLAGWAMFPDQAFVKPRPGDPPDFAVSLHEAAQRIADANGGSRFLPAKFYNLQPAQTVSDVEILGFSLLMMGLLVAKDADVVHTDAAGAFVLLGLMIANAILVSSLLQSGGAPLEPNKDAIAVLDPLDRTAARLAPFPAEVADNPMAPPTSEFPFSTIFTVIRHFGIYHQKLSIVKRGVDDFVGYCGGVDLNPDRLDDVRHLATSPFHDVHARIQGPAVRDLALTFEERWNRDGGVDGPAFATPSAASLGTPGRHVVQVARTYFRAADASRRLPFAPQGDRTINDTMLRALDAAKEFIYIEDQYFTPPAAYHAALVASVTRGIKRLIIALPGITDQPFGELSRSALVNDLAVADAGRGIVRIGYPRRHYTLPSNGLRASSGRCLLTEDLASGGGTTSTVTLGPLTRLPLPPFWLAIEGELMYVNDEAVGAISPAVPAGSRRFAVVRGDSTRLIKGGAAPRGARPREHKAGAAATVVDLSNIYVHAKMMIVDDVFLGLGSANLNRRGLFHDGEVNAFTVPERLKADAANPVRDLRLRLWAEMLDLPERIAAPLLVDPVAATAMFDRSPLLGNRYTDILAYPEHVMFGADGGDGIVSTVLQLGVGVPIVAAQHVKLFDGVVDPTSALEGG